MRWNMRHCKTAARLRAICKRSICVAALALMALIAVGPASSGVINVAPGEASIAPSGSSSSVPLGAIAGLVALFVGDRISKTDRQICTEAPVFAGAIASSDIVRPSRGKATSVMVNGAILLAEGCELKRLTYSVEDEHARFEGAAEALLADDGSFHIEIPLQGVKKSGAHKHIDAQYTITLFAEDEAGVGTSEAMDVMVIDGPRIQ